MKKTMIGTEAINEAIDEIKKYYPFPSIFNRARYFNIVREIVKYVVPKSKILDLGAGPCEVSSILSTLGYKCTAYDDFLDEWLDENDGRQKVFKFAEKTGVSIEVIKTYDKLPFNDESFDVFMMHDVLEHLHDSPRDLLNDAVRVLKENGFLYITVPSIVNLRKRISVLTGRTNMPDFDTFYWYPNKWRGPIREYTRGDLESLCENLGLEVIVLKPCDHMLDRVPRKLLVIYKCFTKVFPDTKDSWLLIAKKPINWKSRKSIQKKEFDLIMKKTQKEHRRKKIFFD